MIHKIQTFLTDNFIVYLLLISLVSYLLLNATSSKEVKLNRQKKMLILGWVIFIAWFTRKMHVDTYVPSILLETFSE